MALLTRWIKNISSPAAGSDTFDTPFYADYSYSPQSVGGPNISSAPEPMRSFLPMFNLPTFSAIVPVRQNPARAVLTGRMVLLEDEFGNRNPVPEHTWAPPSGPVIGYQGVMSSPDGDYEVGLTPEQTAQLPPNAMERLNRGEGVPLSEIQSEHRQVQKQVWQENQARFAAMPPAERKLAAESYFNSLSQSEAAANLQQEIWSQQEQLAGQGINWNSGIANWDASEDMANRLARSGVKTIADLEIRPFQQSGYEGDVITSNALVNKRTGQAIPSEYAFAGLGETGGTWSGTFAGPGSTRYNINFVNGIPVFTAQQQATVKSGIEKFAPAIIGLGASALLGPAGYGLSTPMAGAIGGGLAGLTKSGDIEDALKGAVLGGALAYGKEALFGGALDTAASDLAKIEGSMGAPSLGIVSALPSDLAKIEASMGAPSLTQDLTNYLPTIDTGIAADNLSKLEASMNVPSEGITEALPPLVNEPVLVPESRLTGTLAEPPLTVENIAGQLTPEAAGMVQPYSDLAAIEASMGTPSGIQPIEKYGPPPDEYYTPKGIEAARPSVAEVDLTVPKYETLPSTPPVVETPAGTLSPEAQTMMGGALTGGDPVRAALYGNEGYGPMSDLTVTQAPITSSPISTLGPAATVGDIVEKGIGSLADKLLTPQGLLTAASLLGSGALSGITGAPAGGSQFSIPTKTARREMLPMPEYQPYTGETVMGRQYFTPTTYAAEGGIMQGRYLRGESDGMADEIKTSIGDDQPARLSHGEFVIPADVVSHLGNGNSDAGAKVLYKMMDKVRVARTGSKEQGKQIEPEKFTPGGVAKFQTGGSTANPFAASPYGSTAQTSLSEYAAPYVTGILSEARALGSTPYEAYKGPLSAGYAPLQQTAFGAAGSLAEPTELGAASGIAQNVAGGTFLGQEQQYMNPFLSAVLAPQLQALTRQANIQRTALGPMAMRGGFGSRSELAQRQLDAELMRQQQQIIGQGLGQAYTQGLGQFNTEQARRLSAAQTLGQLGISRGEQQRQNIAQQMAAGAAQRAMEQEGIAARKAQFEEERKFPYSQLQFQQAMLQGLPIQTTSYTPNLTGVQQLAQTGKDVSVLYDLFKNIFKS